MTVQLSARSLLLVVGVSAALAGCASVSEPPPRDGSVSRGAPDRPEAPARASLVGQRAADLAIKYRGAPYRWGGTTPSGFDCSGFVRYVYAQVGVALPHNAARQYEYGVAISRGSLQPGDLVFFDELRHNGIYIGEGRFIHARQTGKRVNIGSLEEDWYRTRWVGARRL